MRKVVVFNNVSLDGYFVDGKGDMSWAHAGREDAEFANWVSANASSGGELLFGRKTYQMMEDLPKLVFSRTLEKVSWKNARLVKGELIDEIRKLKKEDGPGMVILGSGSIVAQLAQHNLIDEYQIALCPTALGSGRTMFEGLKSKLSLKLTKSRAFSNGNVFLCYQPVS